MASPLQGLRLVSFISNLAKFLGTGAPYFRDEIVESLSGIQENLAAVRANYEGDSPEGTESIQACMIETLDLFHAAVDDLLAFMDSGHRPRLREAVERAEEADDILSYIEYQIEQSKQWMSEYSAG
jgi:HEAT repeat protein